MLSFVSASLILSEAVLQHLLYFYLSYSKSASLFEILTTWSTLLESEVHVSDWLKRIRAFAWISVHILIRLTTLFYAIAILYYSNIRPKTNDSRELDRARPVSGASG